MREENRPVMLQYDSMGIFLSNDTLLNLDLNNDFHAADSNAFVSRVHFLHSFRCLNTNRRSQSSGTDIARLSKEKLDIGYRLFH